jgi:anaerobic selenocysteine-containing dehydrogenase
MTANESLHFRSCPLCEATCGLELTVRDGAVVRIRGDRANEFSKGFICPKGSALHRLHTDPDRLRAPVVRRGDDPATATWEEVTWDEAWSVVTDGLRGVIDRHGRDAVAIYMGNPSVHSLGPMIFNGPLVKALGTTNVFSASTVDQMPKHVSSGLLFGNPVLIPVPDLDRTDHLLILGANPYESNGSLCTAPDFPGRLERIRERGGKVIVVDPRRTKTAENADEWIAIRPGTDAHLLVAMLHVLFAEDLVHTGHAVSITSGLDEIRDAVEPFDPDSVASITGIDADTIRRMTRELAAAPTAAVYGRIGTHTVTFGTLASWAVDALNLCTGNLDSPGGAMFPLPAHDSGRGTGRGRGFVTGRRHSRVGGYPEVRGEYPAATLADEITTPGDGQVRALVTIAGNPAVSTPHAGRLDGALADLEFMVCVDPYRNETTRHANVILPPPSALERSDYHLAFFGLAVHNFAEWSPPLFPTDAPQEHEILGRLALIATGPEAGDDPAVLDTMLLHGALQRAIDATDSPIADRTIDELLPILFADPDRTGVDRIIDVMIRTGAYGDWFGAVPDGISLDSLAVNEHGIDLGALNPRLPDVLRTRSGTIELASEPILGDLRRLADTLAEPAPDPDALVLIGRRHLRSNNSWMHNIDVLAKGRFRCTLQVHPDDADRLGLVDGADAEITARVGVLVAQVEFTDTVSPGVVSLPHGWGHDRPGTAARVAEVRPGVNSNVLTDPLLLDPLSGNAVLNGIPVTVRPVQDPAEDISFV